MAQEIERKFLVTSTAFLVGLEGTRCRQGYIATRDTTAVRVRLMGQRAFLTLKGNITGISRAEYEYPIPVEDADQMLDSLCDPPLINKTRYRLEHQGMVWEVDVFAGDNIGLVVAEIELEHEDQAFEKPPWLGQEVSHDKRYLNFNLSRTPYNQWR
jgi:adenylate cyclase